MRNGLSRILAVAAGMVALGGSNAQAAALWGAQEDARAVARQIEGRHPRAIDIFVNCPTVPRARAEARCEFRFLEGPGVTQGQAVLAADGVNEQVLPRAPRLGRECPVEPWNSDPDLRVLRVQGKGIPCYLSGRDGQVLARALERRRRIPRRFTTAAEGSLRRGFVINRFVCETRRREVGSGSPAGSEEVAFRCANRFGDGFLYVYRSEPAA